MARMSGDEERAAGVATSAEDGEKAPSFWQPIINIGGLLVIVAVFVVLMMRIGGRGEGTVGSIRSEDGGSDRSTADARETATGSRGYLTMAQQGRDPLPLLLPYDPAVPDREPLAGLPGAVERFGESFTIRHPAYLPADVAPFTVTWQPDARPDRRAEGSGELFTWFYSAEHGAVLLLAQGPGAGVWPLTADDRRAGRVRLADGTEAVWVIGHPMSVTGSMAGRPMWEGTEVTIGVPATGGGGWYLSSPVVSLEELIRVANSLQPVTARQ